MNKPLIGILAALVIATVLAGTGAILVFSKDLVFRQPFSSSQPTDSGAPSETDGVAGKQSVEIEVDGVTREFVVYRPTNVSTDEALPVVFMFHGSGGTGDKFYNISGWKEKADEEGIVVVFPTALKYHVFADEKVKKGEVVYDLAAYKTQWNTFGLEEYLDPEFPNQTTYDDIHFVQGIVAYLNEHYAVDEDRFYATGHSNGAGFTSRLNVQMSDVFAAFGVAGSGHITDEEAMRTNEYTDAPFQARPVFAMIGEVDPKLAHAAGVEAFPMDESVVDPTTVMKQSVVVPYLALLGLKDEYQYERTEYTSHFTYAETIDGEGEQEYHLMIMEDMGHMYPNGKRYPLEAVDIFWPFFEQYQR